MAEETQSDPGLEVKVQWVEASEEATQDSRTSAERDRDYYDNKQWSDDERKVLEQRGQAPIVINRIKPKVDFLRGVERRLRSDPKAYPRTPQHEDDAESATDSIRFVCDNNDWDSIRSRVWDNLVIEGMGGCDVVVEPLPDGRFEIRIHYVSWDRIGYDPHAREPDFSDAKYKFMLIWMDKEDAVERWPEKADEIDASFVGASSADTFDDTPKFTVWADSRRERVRIVQMHYLDDDQWWQCAFVKGGFLEDPTPSPYLDEFGSPESSLILTSAHIDRDNNRYGWVRSMIWPQDEINKRRSKALHLLNAQRVISSGDATLGDGMTTDAQRIKEEVARPDAYIITPPNTRFDVETNTELATGQLGLLQEAKVEIDQQGPNTALQGDVEGESGRAIQAKQQGGFIEMEPLTDGQRMWARAVYRAIWNRIQQFWNEERWIRVTDDERNLRWVGMNVTLASQLQQMPDEERAVVMQQLQLVPGDPRLQQVVQNPVAELDVDISLDDGPDIVTLRDEQFSTLAGLFRDGVLPQEMSDLLIEASDLRNKEAILERLRGSEEDIAAQQEQAAKQAEVADVAQTIQLEGAAAEVEKVKSETLENKASAAETMADTRKKVMEAESGRRQLGLL